MRLVPQFDLRAYGSDKIESDYMSDVEANDRTLGKVVPPETQ